jgi:hypothetical protein
MAPAERDQGLDQTMKANSTARWAFAHGMSAMGAPTSRAYLAASPAYSYGKYSR